MNDRVARMVAEAEARIADATIIGESMRSQSDSQALLRILALEVLLKAVQLQATGAVSRSHRYLEIWSGLPTATRDSIATAARTRYPGQTDLSNIEKLLCVYEYLFTKARYGYELYEHLSLQEQHELGQEWLSNGASTEEADVQYFPLELSALLHGLQEVVRGAA